MTILSILAIILSTALCVLAGAKVMANMHCCGCPDNGASQCGGPCCDEDEHA